MLEINVLEVPNRPNIPEVSPFRKKKKKMELNLNLPYSPERASVSGMRDNEILKPEQRSDLSKAYHISPVSLAVDIRSKL